MFDSSCLTAIEDQIASCVELSRFSSGDCLTIITDHLASVRCGGKWWVQEASASSTRGPTTLHSACSLPYPTPRRPTPRHAARPPPMPPDPHLCRPTTTHPNPHFPTPPTPPSIPPPTHRVSHRVSFEHLHLITLHSACGWTVPTVSQRREVGVSARVWNETGEVSVIP